MGDDGSGQLLLVFQTPSGVEVLAGPGTGRPSPSGGAAVDGDNVAFIAGNIDTLYAKRNGVVTLIADSSTPVPNGQSGETFLTFFVVDMVGDQVVFSAAGNQFTDGIYLDAGNGIQKLWDTTDDAPGGNVPSQFVNLGNPGPAFDGSNIVFFGEGMDGREGLYISRNLGPLEVIDDKGLGSGDTLPGGPYRVDRVTAMSISGGNAAFVGWDEDREKSGLYVTETGANTPVFVTGSGKNLGGKVIDAVAGTPEMRDGNTLSMGVRFSPSDFAIYWTGTSTTTAGMITNGSFANGISGWTTTGNVIVVPGAVELTSDDAGLGTAEISQSIDTYNGTFMIWFDYRFTTTVGSLDVLIDGTLVDSIPAPATLTPAFQQARVTVNDPALMGRNNVDLTFRLNPGSLADIFITTVFSPDFSGLLAGSSTSPSTVIARGNFDCPNDGEDWVVDPNYPAATDSKPPNQQARAMFDHAAGLDRVSAETWLVKSIFGLQWGNRTMATARSNDLCAHAGISAEISTDYTVIGTTDPAPIIVDLYLDGRMEFNGDFTAALPNTTVAMEVLPWITTRRVADETRPFQVPTGYLRATQETRSVDDLELSDALQAIADAEKLNDPNDPDSITVEDLTQGGPSGTLAIKLQGVIVSTNKVYVPNLAQVELSLSEAKTTSSAQSAFNGTADADFLTTFSARLTSPDPGTRVVPAALDPDIAINAGHAGAWFNPATPGQGLFADIEPDNRFMFLSWFTYSDAEDEDPGEQHWYTAQGNYNGAQAELVVYETLGGKFDDPQVVDTEPVGTASVIFHGCETGEMLYQLNDGRLGTFPLQRVIPGSEDACEDLLAIAPQAVDINAGMDGAWFEPATAGQGFFTDVHAASNFIFASWFTYGDDTASGQRWLTAQGNYAGSRAEIPVFETTGGLFDDPQAVNTVQVGTMTIDFEDCNNATLSYSLTDDGLVGDIDITRVVPGTDALCDDLTTPQ